MATRKAEVEQAEQPAVPALVHAAPLEIDADDIALPRVYCGQFSSDFVQNDLAEAGAIFTALSKDDSEPVILSDGTDTVRLHVIGMRKGKSVSAEGELVLYAYDDPDAPPEAWTTYNYVVALPKVDQEVPYKILLTRSNTATAKKINFVLSKHAAQGPPHQVAFDITTAPRQNQKGKFWVFDAKHVDADADDVKVAESLLALAVGGGNDIEATGDEPAI